MGLTLLLLSIILYEIHRVTSGCLTSNWYSQTNKTLFYVFWLIVKLWVENTEFRVIPPPLDRDSLCHGQGWLRALAAASSALVVADVLQCAWLPLIIHTLHRKRILKSAGMPVLSFLKWEEVCSHGLAKWSMPVIRALRSPRQRQENQVQGQHRLLTKVL